LVIQFTSYSDKFKDDSAQSETLMRVICPLFRRALAAVFMLCFFAAAAAAADVSLSWDPNTEADLAGYKIYYGTTSGVYSTIISAGLQTAYTVTNLPAGTYYFAVTAINSSGLEGGYSNEVSTTVGGATAPCKCDLNNDTKTDALDLQIMVNAILGISTPAAGTGDLNGDGRIDALDLQILSNVILGLRSCPS
jgi:hypothetical protein